MHRWLRAGTVAALLATGTFAARAGDVAGLLALQRYDEMVLRVGYRLAVAGADLCPATAMPLTGLLLHDLAQYPDGEQAAARKAYGFDGRLRVLAVAPGSPAERAGITGGDAVEAIDGQPVPPATAETNSYARLGMALAQIERAAADGALTLTLTGKGAVPVTLERGCATRFQVRTDRSVNAAADGDHVEVNTGMVDFAGDDATLAYPVAHELAHNILRHRQWLNDRRVARGLGRYFGRSARLWRQSEEEADRLAVHLVARAGYPLDGLKPFFRREYAGRLGSTPDHLDLNTRLSIVDQELARIEAARRDGQASRPAFMTTSAPGSR